MISACVMGEREKAEGMREKVCRNHARRIKAGHGKSEQRPPKLESQL